MPEKANVVIKGNHGPLVKGSKQKYITRYANFSATVTAV